MQHKHLWTFVVHVLLTRSNFDKSDHVLKRDELFGLCIASLFSLEAPT